MDFSLTEEQKAVQELSRKILEDLATPERLKEIEAGDEAFDRRLWDELARANLLGVAVDEAHGGADMGYFTLCILLEEIGRAVAPVPALASLVLAGLPLQRFGSEAQKSRWLPGLVAGERILSAALQEPGADDPTHPATRATRDGDGWKLTGRKICVPAAHLAERILVSARCDDDGAALCWIDPGADGVALTRQELTHRQPHFTLDLDAARVPADEVLADGAEGAAALAWLAERASTALCALQLGVSERSLEMTAEYAGSRVQFDRPIGSFQAVHQRAADAYIQLEAIRLTTWDAAWRLDAEEPAGEAVEIAKYWACEAGQFVGYAAQHLHGGIGIDVDYPMHRYYLWAKYTELMLGSAPVQLERLGARLAEGFAPLAD